MEVFDEIGETLPPRWEKKKKKKVKEKKKERERKKMGGRVHKFFFFLKILDKISIA